MRILWMDGGLKIMDSIPQLAGRPSSPMSSPTSGNAATDADLIAIRLALGALAAWLGQTPPASDSKLTAAALEALRAAAIR